MGKGNHQTHRQQRGGEGQSPSPDLAATGLQPFGAEELLGAPAGEERHREGEPKQELLGEPKEAERDVHQEAAPSAAQNREKEGRSSENRPGPSSARPPHREPQPDDAAIEAQKQRHLGDDGDGPNTLRADYSGLAERERNEELEKPEWVKGILRGLLGADAVATAGRER